MKKSVWGVIGVAAYILFRFAAIAMKHPDWQMNDWLGFLGFVVIAGVVVLGIVWLFSKKKPAANPAVANALVVAGSVNGIANIQSNPSVDAKPIAVATPATPIMRSILSPCPKCGMQIELDAKFCCECGNAVA